TAAGHDTHRAAPALGPRAAGASFSAWSAAAYLRGRRFDRERMQRRTRRLAALGERTVQARLYGGLMGDGVRARAHAMEWFASGDYDVLLTPALAGPPPAAEVWSTRGLRDNVAAAGRVAAYTALWGLIGFPAMVVPVGERGDGLPASVQLIAPPGRAGLLFDLAAHLTDLMRPRRYAPTLRPAGG
ncbi:MAG: amidase family protein, partial [Stackebrandtia sp.]